MYADIIIDITHEKLDKVFQYRVPEELEGDLRTGAGVIDGVTGKRRGILSVFRKHVIMMRKK